MARLCRPGSGDGGRRRWDHPRDKDFFSLKCLGQKEGEKREKRILEQERVGKERWILIDINISISCPEAFPYFSSSIAAQARAA